MRIDSNYVAEQGWNQETIKALLEANDYTLKSIFGCVPEFDVNDTIIYTEMDEPIEILMMQESSEFFSGDNGYLTGSIKALYSPLEEIPLE